MSDTDLVKEMKDLEMETDDVATETIVDKIMKDMDRMQKPKESVKKDDDPKPSTSSQPDPKPLVTYPPAPNFLKPKTPPPRVSVEQALAEIAKPLEFVTPLDIPTPTDRQIVPIQMPVRNYPNRSSHRQGRVSKANHNRNRNRNFRLQHSHFRAIGSAVGDAIFTLANQEYGARRPWYRHRRQPPRNE